MAGRVGTNVGIVAELNYQRPARPPIPRDPLRYEPRGNVQLRDSTKAAILRVASQGPTAPYPKVTIPPPNVKPAQQPPLQRPKRTRREPTEPALGYREERRAVRARNDELGKLIKQQTKLFSSMSWEQYVNTLRGRGDLAPDGRNVQHHPAVGLLKHLSKTGAPAIMETPPWELKLLDQRLKRGSHKSCTENLDFLRGEMLDFVKKNFWTVLPYRVLRDKYKDKLRYLRDLRLSPMGVVPQRER